MPSEPLITPLNARPLVRIEKVTLDFPAQSRSAAGLRALDDVSLDIAAGEIIGLVGESGSGKTTLGKTLLGMYPVGSGHIWYEGADVTAPDALRLRRRDLQMVFQDPLSSFNPRFRIGDSVALPLRLHGICSRKEMSGRVGKSLERVGLSADYAHRFPHELSGGQLQRVAIARVLGIEPKLIVADEAVSKLDVSVRAQILNLLKAINRDTRISIVFITHDLSVARFLCNRIAVMYFGRIVEFGPTESIFADPRHPYTRRLLEARRSHSLDESSEQPTDPMTASRGVDRLAGCNYRDRCPARIGRCEAERPSLEGASHDRRFACFNPRGDHGDGTRARVVAR